MARLYQRLNKRTFIVGDNVFAELPAMMLASLAALKAVGGSAQISELDEKVVELEGVSEAEQQLTMPNDLRPRLNYYLAWSRTYLRRGGAIENSSRGVWSITDLGEKIDSREACQAIRDRVLAEERDKARQRKGRREVEPVLAPDGAREVTSVTSEMVELAKETEPAWKAKLLATVMAMEPSAFERLSQRLLREAGFTKVEVRGKSGDGGIDGLGVLRVNLVSFQVYFQCKKWQGSVPPKEIRDFRGALQGRADKGLFITTGTFTSQATDEATREGAIAIDLIDGDRLCELLKQFELGVQTRMVEQVTISAEWFGTV